MRKLSFKDIDNIPSICEIFTRYVELISHNTSTMYFHSPHLTDGEIESVEN